MRIASKNPNLKIQNNESALLIPPSTIRRVVINSRNYKTHCNYLQHSNLTIVCDWFEVNATFYHNLIQGFDYELCNSKDLYTNDLAKDLVITYKGYGKSVFKRSFDCYYNGNLVCEIFAVPKFEKTMSIDTINLKIANNLLYTKNWIEDYQEVIDLLNIKVNNISRLDIAIDGANGMINFITDYTKQFKVKQNIIRTGQAQLNPIKFKEDNLSYQAFTIGSRSSDKYMVIYQKSKELEISNKTYIKEFWQASGLAVENVERAEIRLNNKFMGTITGLLENLKQLQDTNYLATIFKNAIEHYCDFRFNTSENTSYCDRIELIDFSQFTTTLLERTKKALVDGRFRIKVSIKSAVETLLKGYIDEERRDINLEYIKESLTLYSLHEWYEKKIPEWHVQFKTNQRTGHIYQLSTL